MVTPSFATSRAIPAQKPVRPVRAPFERPRIAIGDFTAPEVMFTIRPNVRSIIPSIVALISSMAVSMLASTALIQSSRVQSRKVPGGGPPALFTRMSRLVSNGASAFSRPSAVVMSHAMACTVAPVADRISSAVASIASGVRAQIVKSTPFCASAMADALPRPLLDAQTRAFFPLIPRSMDSAPFVFSLAIPVLCSSPRFQRPAYKWQCDPPPIGKRHGIDGFDQRPRFRK